MPEENKFFRFVWRFNALALAVTALAVIASMVAFGLASFRFERDWMADTHLKNVVNNEKQKFAYRLSDADDASLQHQKLFVLQRWEGETAQPGLSDSYSGRSGQDVNLLIVDETGAGRWVFRGNERTISSRNTILESEQKAGSGETPQATGLAITVIDSDTNGDGRLTAKDRQTLYGYRLGSERPVKLMTADDFLGARQFGVDKYLVVYAEKDNARVAVFSLPDFKLISDNPLPNVPK